MDLIKANDSLTLRVTLNICYFLIPIHFDHTLCTEKSICLKAPETKPNIFVKGGNFGIKAVLEILDMCQSINQSMFILFSNHI